MKITCKQLRSLILKELNTLNEGPKRNVTHKYKELPKDEDGEIALTINFGNPWTIGPGNNSSVYKMGDIITDVPENLLELQEKKITRKQLRSIINEELGRLDEIVPQFVLGGMIGALITGTPLAAWFYDIIEELKPDEKKSIKQTSAAGLGEYLDNAVNRPGTSEAKLFYTLDEIGRRVKELSDEEKPGFWKALYQGTSHGQRIWNIILADLDTDDVNHGSQVFVQWLRAVNPPSSI